MNKTIEVKELKQIQLGIMDYFHGWCRENSITYYITAGTLIGALRHKGYIPWDDDIDIVMLRNDYDKMIRLFSNSDTGPYNICSIETEEDCIYTYAKIYDSRTIFVEGDESNHQSIGVNIDIFPLENATDSYEDAIRLKKSVKLYDDILTIKKMSRQDRGLKKNIVVAFLKVIANFFPFHWLITRIIKRATKYLTEVKSRYVVNAVIYAKGECEILEREWFKDTVELDFEGRKYLAPVGADQYMRRLFGDYMQLPPEDKRVSHHRFKAYYK